jgi:hypothetical protein
MRKISYSAEVYASRKTVWELLLEKVENPQNYIPGVTDVAILERHDNVLLREIKTQGMTMREKVTIDEPHGEVRYLLLEHPLLTGEVTNRVAPSAVQSPVAPQVLTILVDWAPKDEHAENMIRTDMPVQIQREVLVLKELAEERDTPGKAGI